jgi:hypothetical protein
MKNNNQNIPLHPEHGLNPGMSACFFCGKEKPEIILFGNNLKERAGLTPRIMNLEPCAECKEAFKDKMVIVRVERKTVKNQARTVPTGAWMMFPEDCIDPPVWNPGQISCLESKQFDETEEYVRQAQAENKKQESETNQ